VVLWLALRQVVPPEFVLPELLSVLITCFLSHGFVHANETP